MDSGPLLTIAVPTFNRSRFLAELLETLVVQLASHPEIELLISDNASTDETPALIAAFQQKLPTLRSIRNEVNIGADNNFVQCFHASRGRYLWLVGDDDLLVPHAIETVLRYLSRDDYDLVYLASYAFRKDYLAEREADSLGRSHHIITDATTMMRTVNVMFTFISGMIVNKERLQSLPHIDPAEFASTNLAQLSWALPLLAAHRKSLCIWERLVAGRSDNGGGYNIGQVFGRNLKIASARLLPTRPDLARLMMNITLRRWFPSIICQVRTARAGTFDTTGMDEALREVHGRNPRYWFFIYPVLHWPLGIARVWEKAGAALSKLIYVATVPRFWRKEGQ